MTLKKLNVLVYAGTGTTSESVRHCLLTLRRLLYPNYAVIPVDETALVGEPWQASCALLVIPGGADVGYSRVLNGAGNRRIAQYVRGGGRYLGLCAGGYYGSERCEFEVGNKPLEVIGRRELGLFRGTCRGCAYGGFVYHSEAGARAVQLTVHTDAFSEEDSSSESMGGVDVPASTCSYYNGGGVFVDAAKSTSAGVQVLASYTDDIAVDGGKGDQKAAVIYCPVGEGAALLTGPHPEFEPSNLVDQPELPTFQNLLQTLRRDDETTRSRVRFLKACIRKLGLELGSDNAFQPRLTSWHVTTLYTDEAQELAYKWEEIMSKKKNRTLIRGEQDTFRVILPDSGPSAWPSEADVATLLSSEDAAHGHLPFSTSMAMDLTDRALRYPKLSGLVESVSSGTANKDEQATFSAIIRAIAAHEEEGDDTDAFVTAPLEDMSINQFKETWRKRREAFDHTVGAVYRAVGHTLLKHPDDVPLLDTDLRQEMWSSLVHLWEHKRRQKEENEAEERRRETLGDKGGSSVATVVDKAQEDRAGRSMQLEDDIAGDDADDGTVKRLVLYEHGWPCRIATFDYGIYYRALAQYRRSLRNGEGIHDDDLEWGNQIMYAKVTTSTNTILEKNPKLLATLPAGFTVTATRQLAARGRGSNVWLAPEGQLISSTVISHPHRFSVPENNGSSSSATRPVVFIQYLAAIAIIEAIHGYAPGFEALDVKLKWPNDIYARATSAGDSGRDKPGAHSYVKIGGILSMCSFFGNHYRIVLGIGLNAVNRRPTTSLEALVPEDLRASVTKGSPKPVFRVEKLLASLLVQLEVLYKKFLHQGFAGDLERQYYRHWLHTDQVVTLEAITGSPRARVLGISSDWGLLEVAELVPDDRVDSGTRQTGRIWRLQSDENSFDYWKGLVRTKT